MDQLQDLADERLINGCVYCGGPDETREHVPSRFFLEEPYPDNLPVIGACKSCNQGFSSDEQYLVCFIEAVLSGTTNPDQIKRRSVARSLQRSPLLQARLEAAKRQVEGRIEFAVEEERIKNVMLKLARGHAVFELSQPCREAPDRFWCGSLHIMPQDARQSFEAPHAQTLLGEVGSRNTQRLLATTVTLRSPTGEMSEVHLILNDWVDVQEGRYRYLAIHDVGGIAIRIVIAEYLACEIVWDHD